MSAPAPAWWFLPLLFLTMTFTAWMTPEGTDEGEPSGALEKHVRMSCGRREQKRVAGRQSRADGS